MGDKGLYISPVDRKALIGLSKSEHLVFYCYVSYRNWDTWEAWPKIGTISKKIGVSRNTINNAIPKLKKRNLLQFVSMVKGVVCRYKVGVYRPTDYRGGYYMPLDVLDVLKRVKGGIAFDVFLLMAQKGYAKEGRTISITRSQIAKNIGASKGRITKALTQLKSLHLLVEIESDSKKPKYRIGKSVLRNYERQEGKSTKEYKPDSEGERPFLAVENDTDRRSAPLSKMTQEIGSEMSKKANSSAFSNKGLKLGQTLVENDTPPSQKCRLPSTKMTQTLVENDTHNKSKNKSLNICLYYKADTPPPQIGGSQHLMR